MARGAHHHARAGSDALIHDVLVDRQELEQLLSDLCVGLGFCLPAHEREQLLSSSQSDVDAFTDAVIAAEGLDPAYPTSVYAHEFDRWWPERSESRARAMS